MYSRNRFKNTYVVAPSCGKCGSIDWIWSTFVGTLITLPCPYLWNLYIWAKAKRGEIRHFFNCINFWINGIILFLKFLFDTWFKGGLFSLLLCKQLVHMYNVELGSIWIWKYIECYLDNWFEKHFKCLKKIPFHN